MKKPSSKIREDIARLKDQLRQAEAREAERIGRLALRSGLGEIEIDEVLLQTAFEDIAKRFREGKGAATGEKDAADGRSADASVAMVETGEAQGSAGET
ncbi:TraC family protein [Rhizobium sp. P40RR-XXII]|uniref:conjugal transfer protein TraC n=1 Tax=unclassified Rhizobium TaxID=2613769 RepID=UPI0014575A6D|nr:MULTISPECIES: conjugal transfer protein TraC [unclassified Rhizobium]NLR88768.1 TraC family protein [Rhizobium sp. P28RR-XV]NLS20223.1 TraC family protein [Rhizobium sp. P40RR-XXII]